MSSTIQPIGGNQNYTSFRNSVTPNAVSGDGKSANTFVSSIIYRNTINQTSTPPVTGFTHTLPKTPIAIEFFPRLSGSDRYDVTYTNITGPFTGVFNSSSVQFLQNVVQVPNSSTGPVITGLVSGTAITGTFDIKVTYVL